MGTNPSDEIIDRTDLFAGRFQILEKIGSGATGDVYKVRDNVLKRIAAIKLMRFRQSDERKVMRFQKEARASSKLTHRGLLEVFDFGIADDGTPYLVMEFVDGRSLDKILEECGTLELERALTIASLTAEAMHFAHESKVIHRDLKPSNIMIVQSGDQESVKVIDFGTATVLEDEVATGVTLSSSSRGIGGTPNYMSPEQAAKTGVDKRADIYSLGCIIFTLITGRPPYLADSPLEIFELHRVAPIPSLAKFAPEKKLPENLVTVVSKMLAKDKNDRFDDMKDVQKELEKSIAELDVPEVLFEPEVTIPAKSGKNKWRFTVVLAITGTVGMGAAMAIGYFCLASQIVQSSDPKETLAIIENSVDPKNSDSSTDFDYCASIAGDRQGKVKINLSPDIRLLGEEIKDRAIENIVSGNPDLVRLTITKANVSDVITKSIAKSQKLSTVNLDFCPKITNDALKAFIPMKSLQSLSLRGDTAITDRGMTYLASCPQIKQLTLSNNKNITVRGVEKLAPMNLFQISLGDTALKGKDFLVLQKFRHLSLLGLDRSIIDEEDMRAIRELKFLKRVSLSHSTISDEALLMLADLPNLKDIRMADSHGYSLHALARLRAAIGNRCLIETKEPYRDLKYEAR